MSHPFLVVIMVLSEVLGGKKRPCYHLAYVFPGNDILKIKNNNVSPPMHPFRLAICNCTVLRNVSPY